jgi:hypothetical protein
MELKVGDPVIVYEKHLTVITGFVRDSQDGDPWAVKFEPFVSFIGRTTVAAQIRDIRKLEGKAADKLRVLYGT